jgi:methyltransferase (TIGR00027 family)
MQAADAKSNVARTAHLTAGARALGRLIAGDEANGDYLADNFLLPVHRWLRRSPRAARWLLERMIPGAFGYFNARTRYFDEVLRQRAAEVGQLVLLGAGFDSRPLRFAKQLAHVRVFEVDMPQVLSLRGERLRDVADHVSRVQVPIDFEHDDLGHVLCKAGFEKATRSFFLWEGVTYYLPPQTVDAVLDKVAVLSAPGSSLLFDYVTHAFFAGDYTSHGAKGLAAGWRRMGNVNRSGVRDVEVLLGARGYRLEALLSPDALERGYLSPRLGETVKIWGMMRIVHALRI